ncbi:MAG TPA: error-prone DNA polymerase [Blastocatellia bacterium]|nr:error-prone DNA polymerase [Blastocatellia bacterium]
MTYAELHAKSAFSFLEGASLPEELATVAAELEIPAMALLDRDGVYGAPQFYKAARKNGVQPHVGAEITLIRKGQPTRAQADVILPLLVENRTGYQNLCRLITRMKLRAEKGEGSVTLDEVAEHAEGLVCLTGGANGPLAHAREVAQTSVCAGTRFGSAAQTEVYATRVAEQLVAIFGRENVYAELQRHYDREEEARNQAVVAIARRLGLPLLATNGVTHVTASQREILDVLTCVKNKVRLDTAGRLLAKNSERHVKSASEMSALFADLPEAIANTCELSSRLEYTMQDLGYRFPKYPVPEGETMNSFLRKRTWEGARLRYTTPATFERARLQIERELALIEKLDLAGYFLIVWDIVEFCRANGILVQGRGSAANSAVCYSLRITAVDPVGMELLFERFLSEERGEWPDIDLDLPSGDQRERAIQYVYERYGKLGAAMTANVITYRGRSAAREVGKVLGFDETTLARLSSLAHVWGFKDPDDTAERQFSEAGLDPDNPRIKKFMQLYDEVQDLPRHLGQHSGGMVICQGQLDSVVPLEPARMPGRVVVQWDKDDCADMGIIKVDLLGLGMMAALEESLALIRDHYGEEVDLAHLPPDDPQVYDALQKADTIGLFQVESRAQMSCLPRLRPKCFYDIVVQVAIIRPGPIVGEMLHPYLRRRQGREKPDCIHPALEPVLRRTLGVPLFQEQLLRIAMICAGFSGGEAEELRRALGFKRSEARMRDIEVKLRRGMERNGITGKPQDAIVKSITAFALYGFPESHAASFALIAYASAYLKCHYLAAFTCAILNNQPMGFYHPFTIIKDAQRHGLRVLPADVTRSDWNCTVEEDAGCRIQDSGEQDLGFRIQDLGQLQATNHESRTTNHAPQTTNHKLLLAVRLGLRYVKGLREETARAIIRERERLPFTSIDDLQLRVRELRKDELRKLARAGALNNCGSRVSSTSCDSQPAIHNPQQSPQSSVLSPHNSARPAIQNPKSKIRNPLHRRSALWQTERASRPAGPLLEKIGDDAGSSPLTPMTIQECISADVLGTGVTVGRHPLAHYREELNRLGALRAIDLAGMRNGTPVRIAGCVICRQRPGTAKGFFFLSLEDETGIMNAIVTPDLFDRARAALVNEPYLMIDGELQNLDNVASVKAEGVQGLFVTAAAAESHDFH